MPPRKKQENRDTGDGPRKRRRADAQKEDRVVISDSDEDEDFRSSPREERKRQREIKTRSNEMTEEEMLDLAVKLSKEEASSAALRQQQDEEAVRKAIAESLHADRPSPSHHIPKSQSSLSGNSIQPPRRKLSYPNSGAADRDKASGGSVSAELALSDRLTRGKKSPLPDMPDLSQTQKICSQSHSLSQASTSETLPSSQDKSSSQMRPSGDPSTKAMEDQDCSNSPQSASPSQRLNKSSTSTPIVCLKKLSPDLVDCQASGILLNDPTLTFPTVNQMSQSFQPRSPTFDKSPVFSKTVKHASDESGGGSLMFSQSSETDSGKEEKGVCLAFPKGFMFSSSETGEEEKEASPTFPRSPVFSKTNGKQGEEQECPTLTQSHTLCSTKQGPEETEKSPIFPSSPVLPRKDDLRAQGPQSGAGCVSTAGVPQETPACLSPAVKSSDPSQGLSPPPRRTLSLNKRLVPIRKTSRVADEAVDHDKNGIKSTTNANKITTPAKLEYLTFALKPQHIPELTSNMVLCLSDDDDDVEEDCPGQSAPSPSPVFPLEKNIPQPRNQGFTSETDRPGSPTQSPCLIPNKRTLSPQDPVCQEVERKKKVIRKKFTFKGMYEAPRQAAGTVTQEGAHARSPPSHHIQASSSHFSPPTESQSEGGVVCYYWGVPFCPRGQNPDTYTKVILSQLEVYEKSLKKAQRGLLRKTVWGEPVVPGPPERTCSLRGRTKRHKAPQLLEEEETGEMQEEEEEEEVVEVLVEEGGNRRLSLRLREDKGRRRREQWKETEALFVSSPEPEDKSHSPVFHAESSQQPIRPPRRLSLRREARRPVETQPPDPVDDRDEEKKRDDDDEEDGQQREEGISGEELDVNGLEVPETQLSDDSTPDLMVTSPPAAQAENQPLPQIQIFLSSPHRLDEREEGMEVDGEEEETQACPMGSPASREDVKMDEEQDQEAHGSVPEPASTHSPGVDCPICMQPFPRTEIEMHAAYCDLQTEDVMAQESQSKVAVRACRKRNRRGELIEEEQPSSSRSSSRTGQGEKCYLCQQCFPLRDYGKHVEDCIKNQQQSTAAPRTGQSGDLLRALDQTEHKDSGNSQLRPCDTTFQNRTSGQMDDLEAAESGGSGELSAPGFIVSTSPIRSFTAISEATDCLIDFKHQYSSSNSARPSQRGKKFKRKFKR
ncbi:hypothetical protein UPYG_G00122320 [Umbra pygmaea]|uniref:BRCA1-A complex subunit RAP80 n=1 Tax=Umbra pygmaea TaxID=75934 RepID=A0ABD0X633_UMBPY